MKIGEIQEKWLISLETNGARQMNGALAHGNPDSYIACCLGEFVIVKAKHEGKEPVFVQGELTIGVNTSNITNYEDYGLFDEYGSVEYPDEQIAHKFSNGLRYLSLTEANDYGISWLEIATFIRANPEKIFTKPV